MERPISSPLLQTMLPVPKARGRPRASYAQTGEFDLGLIREYRSRPALYDRTNKRFKDKIHIAQLWMQISHKLGYDVSILRERMITLRNRYNIEKRRVENSSVSSSIVGSQWPLFDNLSFLSEHIRTRRSYKMQSKSLDGRPDEDEDEEHFDVDDMTNLSNEVNIKHELDSGEYDETDDYDCDRQLPVTAVLNIPMATQQTNPQSYNSTQRNGHMMLNGKCGPPNNVSLHMGDTTGPRHKRTAPQMLEEVPNKRRLDAENILKAATVMTGTEGREYSRAVVASTAPATTTYPKFRAFGEFVSHSLTELPHTTSMRLVEKFTRELVQAAIAIDEEKLQQHSPSQSQSQSKAQQQQAQQRIQGSAEPSSMDEMDE